MKTEETFLKIKEKLKRYNYEYYNTNPTINDYEYDNLKTQN